jgi:hypothetical protein
MCPEFIQLTEEVFLGLPARRLLRASDSRGWAILSRLASSIVEAHGEIVAMYAMVNRIRLFASGSVLEAADAFVKALVEKYGEKI